MVGLLAPGVHRLPVIDATCCGQLLKFMKALGAPSSRGHFSPHVALAEAGCVAASEKAAPAHRGTDGQHQPRPRSPPAGTAAISLPSRQRRWRCCTNKAHCAARHVVLLTIEGGRALRAANNEPRQQSGKGVNRVVCYGSWSRRGAARTSRRSATAGTRSSRVHLLLHGPTATSAPPKPSCRLAAAFWAGPLPFSAADFFGLRPNAPSSWAAASSLRTFSFYPVNREIQEGRPQSAVEFNL